MYTCRCINMNHQLYANMHNAIQMDDQSLDPLPQDLLVCVTVNKANFAGRPNEDIFVTVDIDGTVGRQTATSVRSEAPVFNEYFVFELRLRLGDLLRRICRVAAYRKTCCCVRRDECIGAMFIELHTVWSMDNHSFYKKWIRLENVSSVDSANVFNYIQLDMSVISKGAPPCPILLLVKDYDIIEDNMLTVTSSPVDRPPRHVSYCVNVFSAMFAQKRDYYISVKFAGSTGKTRTVAKTQLPEWNEQLIFRGSFPSLCQSFFVEVRTNNCAGICAVATIHFNEMLPPSRETDQVPSFGPAYVQVSAVDGRTHVGRVLLSIRTEEDSAETSGQIEPVVSMNIPPFVENDFWEMSTFRAHCTLYEATFAADVKLAKVCTRIRWADSSSGDVLHLVRRACDSRRATTVVPSSFETMQVDLLVPDVRFKLAVDNMLVRIVAQLQNQLQQSIQISRATSEHNRILLNRIITAFSNQLTNFREYVCNVSDIKYTEWDQYRRRFLVLAINECLQRVKEQHQIVGRKSFDAITGTSQVQANLHKCLETLQHITEKHVQNKWPVLQIEFVTSSGKVLAIYRCDPTGFLVNDSDTNHPNQLSHGLLCNEPHLAVFKPIQCQHGAGTQCGCLYAVAELHMSVDRASEPSVGLRIPATISDVNNQVTTVAHVNAFVHQVKLHPESATGDVTDGLRLDVIMVGGKVTSTRQLAVSNTNTMPIWNETLSMSGHLRDSSVESIARLNVPLMVLELVKQNGKKAVSWVCLGRAFAVPTLRVNELLLDLDIVNMPPIDILPALHWVNLMQNGQIRAELLMSADVSYTTEQSLTVLRSEAPDNDVITRIPGAICPVMARYKVEVTFVGLRNWTACPCRTLGRFLLGLSFGDLWLRSGLSSKAFGHSVNVLDPFKSGYVDLPVELEYWPALCVKHIDCSSAKNETVFGASTVTQTGRYFREESCLVRGSLESCALDVGNNNTSASDKQPLIPDAANSLRLKGKGKAPTSTVPFRIRLSRLVALALHPTTWQPTSSTGPAKTSSHSTYRTLSSCAGFTWWTKFYNSVQHSDDYDCSQKHRLRIFHAELESVPEFGGLRDWSDRLDMLPAGQSSSSSVYAQMKIDVKVRRCSDSFSCFTFNKAQQLLDLISERTVLIQVYVVQGINLRPRDREQSSDAYIQIECGRTKICDRGNFVPNQANPVFGKRYQLTAILPKDLQIKISVFDRDAAALFDDHIGSTIIDIEDRLRSRHRAHSGLPNEYNRLGYNVWRSAQTPSQILRQVCENASIDQPLLVGNKLLVGGCTFEDSSTALSFDEPLIERLSLSALKQLDTIPAVGFKLVPEHVETRSLFRNDRPGLEQGKLQMWMEIADPQRPPTVIDISPTPPHEFELRVIVWNTRDVILDEMNIFGKHMSDIFVKGWLDNVDASQSTDVHYRSLTGEGNFNWRMVFPLLYAEAEDMMVVIKRKRFYEQYDTLLKRPVTLNVQIWDNDVLTADDFLGSTSILISGFTMPPKSPADCRLPHKSRRYRRDPERVNLFQRQHSVRGWFPVTGMLKNGKIGQTGKVELELEVLLSATSSPVGLGHSGPVALPMPHRPDTSFKWYASPMQSLRHIVSPALRKLFVWLGIGMLAIVMLFVTYDLLKGVVVNKLSNGSVTTSTTSRMCSGDSC